MMDNCRTSMGYLRAMAAYYRHAVLMHLLLKLQAAATATALTVQVVSAEVW